MAPLTVAYGLGVDSTALLVQLVREGIRPALIMFADTGDEKRETYQYLPIINDYLRKADFPQVTVVRNEVKNFKHWPPYHGLGENCLTNGTLPSLAFGFKSCSQKWKVAPQDRYCKSWQPALDAWSQGIPVRKMIGYDASPNDRKRYAVAIGFKDPLFTYEYPLIVWGWDRERCKEEIRKEGLPVPPKSACVFCPATQPEELHEHRKSYLRYIVIMEARAKPRLQGHIDQEQLDLDYVKAVQAWQEAGSVGKYPKRALQSKGVLGLWRRGVAGTRGGKKRPGMMTDYILEHGLLTKAEVDHLIETVPAEIISNQKAFANGLEIPNWHDFLEQFTEEDAVNEGGRLSLPLIS